MLLDPDGLSSDINGIRDINGVKVFAAVPTIQSHEFFVGAKQPRTRVLVVDSLIHGVVEDLWLKLSVDRRLVAHHLRG